MSEENVAIVKRALEAWNDDDWDAWLAVLHPDMEWDTAIQRLFEGPDRSFRGHAGARKAWEEYRSEALGRLKVRVEAIRDLGESVLLLGLIEATGRSGTEIVGEVSMLMTFEGGMIVRSQDFFSHAEGLQAAGLSE